MDVVKRHFVCQYVPPPAIELPLKWNSDILNVFSIRIRIRSEWSEWTTLFFSLLTVCISSVCCMTANLKHLILQTQTKSVSFVFSFDKLWACLLVNPRYYCYRFSLILLLLLFFRYRYVKTFTLCLFHSSYLAWHSSPWYIYTHTSPFVNFFPNCFFFVCFGGLYDQMNALRYWAVANVLVVL